MFSNHLVKMVLWCLGMGPGLGRPDGRGTKPPKAGKVLTPSSLHRNHEKICVFPSYICAKSNTPRHQHTPYFYRLSVPRLCSLSTLLFSRLFLAWGLKFEWTSQSWTMMVISALTLAKSKVWGSGIVTTLTGSLVLFLFHLAWVPFSLSLHKSRMVRVTPSAKEEAPIRKILVLLYHDDHLRVTSWSVLGPFVLCG